MGHDDISEDDKVAYDKYYLEHQSFIFDLWIIYQTIRNVVAQEGVAH